MTLLKHVASVRISNVDKKTYEGEQLVRLCNYTDVYYGDTIGAGSGSFMAATASREQIRNFRLEPGDSVLTKDSETPNDVGVSAYIESSASDFVCGYHLAVVRPAQQVLHPKYLTWSLRSTPVRQRLTVAATGVTRYGLRAEALANIELELPPLDEQRRIADFLDAQVALLDRAIALRQLQVELVASRVRSALHVQVAKLFAKFGSVPLRRVSRGIEQGSSPDCYGHPAEAGEYGVLKVSAVRRGRFHGEANKALPPEVTPELRYVISRGDVLLTRGSGSRDLVGDVALVDADVGARLLLPDLLYRLRLARDVDRTFVVATLLSPQLRAEVGLATRGAVGGTIKLRGSDVLDLRLPAADAAAQAALGSFWRQQQADRVSLEAGLERGLDLLQERKQALITAAVTGHFDVTTARSAA